MALLVLCYDNLAGKFFSQLAGAAQIADNAIVSGKLADNSIHLGAIPNGLLTSAKIGALEIGDGHIFSGIGANKLLSGYFGYKVASGYPAVGLTGAIPEPRISGLIISGITLSGGLTIPAFTINEDLTARAGTVLASGAGVVDIVDGPIAASGFSSGREVGYFYRLGGMPFLRAYAEPDGIGGLQNRRVEVIQQLYGGSLPVPIATSGGYMTSAFISGGLLDGMIASGITAQKLLSGYFGYKVASGYPAGGLVGFVLPARVSGLPYANLSLSGTIANTDILSGITAAKILSGYGGYDGASGYVLKAQGPGNLPIFDAMTLTVTIALTYILTYVDSDTWLTIRTVSIPATAKKIYAHAIIYSSGIPTDYGVRIVYNGVVKATTSTNLDPISWNGDGLGSVADLEIQGIFGPEGGSGSAYSGAVYVTI